MNDRLGGKRRRLPFVLSALAAIALTATACAQVIVDWVDFVRLDGRTYEAQWEAVVADPSRIGQEVGSVKHMLNGNVKRANYKSKDGDAAYLDKGTKLLSLTGVDAEAAVVVADGRYPNGYKVYANRDDAGMLERIRAEPEPGKTAKVDWIREEGTSVEPYRTVEGDEAGTLVRLLVSPAAEPEQRGIGSGAQASYYSAVVYTDSPFAVRIRIRCETAGCYRQDDRSGKLPDEVRAFLEPR
ncbi:hypothetical protein [Paenibacillus flagellatus]|uniref:Lipoprotein n=1 Tax=Paenibacillus flagellatus TaxID=2211139 RepID=A0A2V5KZB7_9BACL|nr:hypothetical protein [Paenibacillus flagellatus]PYI55426.1 hypothetical protein DLM86_06740 [Paenibacillus flagellatus]